MTSVAPSEWLVRYLKDTVASSFLDKFSDIDDDWGRMIFLDSLPLRLNGTGKRAVTIAAAPGNATPFGSHAYSAFCSVRLYADHTRDVDNLIAKEDGVQRAWAMFGPIDHLLYREDPLSLPGLDTVVQSYRGGPPSEFFDREQDLPYVAVNYDVSVLATI